MRAIYKYHFIVVNESSTKVYIISYFEKHIMFTSPFTEKLQFFIQN